MIGVYFLRPRNSRVSSRIQQWGHLIMNKRIGGHNIFTVGGAGLPFIGAHTASRLLDNEDPCRRVPGFETLFPETVKSPSRHIAKIDGS
jgi:hypothetical protein